jgi:hypothetical protein
MHRYATDAVLNNHYKCPLCAGNRDTMFFSTCKCYIMALRIPTRSDRDRPEDVERMLRDVTGQNGEGVPLTFPELQAHNIHVPKLCRECYRSDVFGVPELLRYLAANPHLAPYPEVDYMARAAPGFLEMADRFHELFMPERDVSQHWPCPLDSSYCHNIHEEWPSAADWGSCTG